MPRSSSTSSSCSDLSTKYAKDTPRTDAAESFFESIDKTGIPSNMGKAQPWQEILRNHPLFFRTDGKVLLKCTTLHDYSVYSVLCKCDRHILTFLKTLASKRL